MTREKAREAIKEAYGNSEYTDEIIKALEQEPKTGYWIEHSNEWGDNWEYSMYECSCCHNWAYEDTDYCPNCGTEMKGGEEV